MTLATGGLALGATSTRSRSTARAASMAIFNGTTPSCLPSGPISRTSLARISWLVFRRSATLLLGRVQVVGVARTGVRMATTTIVDRGGAAVHPQMVATPNAGPGFPGRRSGGVIWLSAPVHGARGGGGGGRGHCRILVTRP